MTSVFYQVVSASVVQVQSKLRKEQWGMNFLTIRGGEGLRSRENMQGSDWCERYVFCVLLGHSSLLPLCR